MRIHMVVLSELRSFLLLNNIPPGGSRAHTRFTHGYLNFIEVQHNLKFSSSVTPATFQVPNSRLWLVDRTEINIADTLWRITDSCPGHSPAPFTPSLTPSFTSICG